METDNIKKAVNLISEGAKLLSRGPLDFYLRKLIANREVLLTRFAPFKSRDRVMIVEAPDPERAPGWSSCLHVLQPGATATVDAVDCDDQGRFQVDIILDRETWIDRYGGEHPVDVKHVFTFHEQDLVRIRDESD